MRLRKIRLAGFKSFVDPTTIDFPGDLIGVVGPNGCGKSNVIDAVRWVMGEVSAKHLRGDTMADVVFTGSNTRKPVGQASVELVFDNADGRLGGRFAAYEEISVRRQVTRESQSTYFLNGARCRRRDVMDVFLGTGLGPRSYAIIEQGMISRLVEAKPEELRDFLEEAAGISKYKERRRETENRIRHTKENLDRLNDLREELGKQLAHLKRQATQAARYKEYKEEERRRQAELLALRWQRLDGEAATHQERVAAQQTVLERVQADLRRSESEIERQRVSQNEQSESFNRVYRDVLDAGAAIARGEESIAGIRERQQQLDETLDTEQANLAGAKAHIREDEQRLAELEQSLGELEPQLSNLQSRGSEARLAFRQTEEAMHAWQAEWEDLTARLSEPAQATHAEQARIQQIEHNRQDLERRLVQVRRESSDIDLAPLMRAETDLEEKVEAAGAALAELQQRNEAQREAIAGLRRQRHEHAERLEAARGRHQEVRGRLGSLQALQEEALGKTDGEPRRWLEQRGIGAAPRLAELVEVTEGWEVATELVLGFRLEAAGVADLPGHLSALTSLEAGPLTLFDHSNEDKARSEVGSSVPGAMLLDHLSLPEGFDGLFAGVRVASNLQTALSLRPGLAPNESVITPDGVWMGRTWVHVSAQDEQAGVLRRARDLEQLQGEEQRLEAEIKSAVDASNDCARQLAQAEDRSEVLQSEVAEQHRKTAKLQSELGSCRARLEQLRERVAALGADQQQAESRLAADERVLSAARERLAHSEQEVERLSTEREAWSRQRDRHRMRLDEARERWQNSRERLYDLGAQGRVHASSGRSSARRAGPQPSASRAVGALLPGAGRTSQECECPAGSGPGPTGAGSGPPRGPGAGDGRRAAGTRSGGVQAV